MRQHVVEQVRLDVLQHVGADHHVGRHRVGVLAGDGRIVFTDDVAERVLELSGAAAVIEDVLAAVHVSELRDGGGPLAR